MKMQSLRSLLLASVVVVAAACAANPSAAGTPSPASSDLARLEAIARARADSGRMRWVQADVDFMTAMIGHHSQAIVMSELAPEAGASPSIRTLAARIISAQDDEIRTMEQWLRERGQPVPERGAHAHHAHGMGGDATMPGMLSEQELAVLRAARGADFDRLFLQSMIKHHRGATAMVSKLFSSFGAGQDEAVFKFASDVNVDQTTEIARMEQMLAALPKAGGS